MVYSKLIYQCSDEFWDRVRAYKRARNLTSLNDAVTLLLTDALDRFEVDQQKTVAFNLSSASPHSTH